MEEIMEKVDEVENIVKQKEQLHKEKKKFTIMGISIWRMLAYFIIYSVVGFIIETAFGFVTKGVIESRQSFLYGPFCAIYGVGAVIMIPILKKFNKNNYTLFFGGFVIGSFVEYIISLIGEFIFHIKWWDYSEMAFNINGRICIAFSFFWGILAIYLMSHFNPIIDRWINNIKEKVPTKTLKTVCVTIIIFLFIDFLVSSFALKMFFTRIVAKYNLELDTYDEYIFECAEAYKNEDIKNFTLKYFSDEKMLKTFPNIKLTGKDGNIIFVKDILSDIQPYYIKVFTPIREK
ncbi:MAG: putative ABC transporter permease [Clostridia bacterium]|nr:putative ABC transporter permease [Clostridia bacterium]